LRIGSFRAGSLAVGLCLLTAVLFSIPADAAAQGVTQLGGTIMDSESGVGIGDVTIRVDGTLLSAVTNADGRFLINDVPEGTVTLRFDHLAYGTHQYEVVVQRGLNNVNITMSQEAIQLEAINVVGQTTEQRERRGRGTSQWVVDRQEIEDALGTSRHLGDLIRQTVPGISLRQSNQLSGNDVCIEFRAAGTLSIANNAPCNSPMVFLDGVPVGDPVSLYGVLSMETIQEIEMLPPGEAGARYGSGSLYGVMLIHTIAPGPEGRPGNRPDRSLRSFDWAQDPAGHDTRRVLLSAFAGNAVGLALGVAAAKSCIAIDEKDEIVTTCSPAGTALAGLSALALPALAGAIGAHWAGGTETSVGRWVPAVASAVLVLVPGYAFSLSTEGGAEADIANVVGGTILVVGVPALLAVADRLFRDIR